MLILKKGGIDEKKRRNTYQTIAKVQKGQELETVPYCKEPCDIYFYRNLRASFDLSMDKR